MSMSDPAWVQERRERILNAKTVGPDLPDTVSCALVGLSFVAGYPQNVRAVERQLSEAYWANLGGPDVAAIPCVLRRNPDNVYDANAIEVRTSDGAMIAHLPRNVARKIAPEIDSGTAWTAALTGVRTHPDDPDNPGVDVLLTRTVPSAPQAPATVDDVIRESVVAMSWSEVHFELATRDLEIPEGIESMRVMLAEVYIKERNDRGAAR